jgi:hypothetical protein
MSDFSVLLLMGGVFAYAAVRVFTLSMTCDEGWSAQDMPYPSLFAFLTPQYVAALNTHLLNTFLINSSVTIFGQHDWAVRLPALLGTGMYLATAGALSLRFTSSWRSPALFVLLACNPYIADFYSLARGYSLGLGFFLLGVRGLLVSLEDTSSRTGGWWSLAAFALAALSNLSFLYPYLAAIAVLIIYEIVSARHLRKEISSQYWLRLVPCVLTLGLLAVLYGEPMILAMRNGEHWWGSLDGLIDGSVASLLRVTLYKINTSEQVLMTVARGLFGMMALIAVCMIYYFWRGKHGHKIIFQAVWIILAFFFIISLGVLLEHRLIGTPFLIERGTFFFYVLFVLGLGFFTEYAHGESFFQKTTQIVFGCVCVCTVINFVVAANFTYTATWGNDACARDFMERIHAENYPRNFTREPLVLSVEYQSGHATQYYANFLSMDYLTNIVSFKERNKANYAIFSAFRLPEIDDSASSRIVMECPVNGLVLVQYSH